MRIVPVNRPSLLPRHPATADAGRSIARRAGASGAPASRRCLAALGLVVLLAGSGPTAVRAEKEQKSRMDRWRAEIVKIDEKQRRGKWKRARRDAEELFLEVRQRGWRQPRLAEVLGEVAAQLAIAEVNLSEDTGRAVWLWHSALLLDDDVLNRDWEAYGRAGKIFLEQPLRPLGDLNEGQKALIEPYPKRNRFRHPEPGEAIDSPTLPMNRAARFERRLLRPTLEVIIHADGSVSHPAIEIGHSAKPTVLLAVLDMIWLAAPYRPGVLDGGPVDVVYSIEVDKFRFLRWDEMFDFH